MAVIQDPLIIPVGIGVIGMADASVDVPDDVFGIVMKEDMEAHSSLMAETVANISHNHNVARSVGVKQYHQVDPLEAAAAEVIGRIKPLV
jgi:hypothetical protein